MFDAGSKFQGNQPTWHGDMQVPSTKLHIRPKPIALVSVVNHCPIPCLVLVVYSIILDNSAPKQTIWTPHHIFANTLRFTTTPTTLHALFQRCQKRTRCATFERRLWMTLLNPPMRFRRAEGSLRRRIVVKDHSMVTSKAYSTMRMVSLLTTLHQLPHHRANFCLDDCDGKRIHFFIIAFFLLLSIACAGNFFIGVYATLHDWSRTDVGLHLAVGNPVIVCAIMWLCKKFSC